MFYSKWSLVVKKIRRCKPIFDLQREVIRCKLYNDRLQRHFDRCEFLQRVVSRCKYLHRLITRCKLYFYNESRFYNDQSFVVNLQRVDGRCKYIFTTTDHSL